MANEKPQQPNMLISKPEDIKPTKVKKAIERAQEAVKQGEKKPMATKDQSDLQKVRSEISGTFGTSRKITDEEIMEMVRADEQEALPVSEMRGANYRDPEQEYVVLRKAKPPLSPHKLSISQMQELTRRANQTKKISDREIMEMNNEDGKEPVTSKQPDKQNAPAIDVREIKRRKEAEARAVFARKEMERRKFREDMERLAKKAIHNIAKPAETNVRMNKNKPLDDNGVTRRNFLRIGRDLGLTFAALQFFGRSKIFKNFWNKSSIEDDNHHRIVDDSQLEEDEEIQDEKKVTKNLEKEEEDNIKSIDDYIGYNTDYVEYGLEEEKKIEEMWYKQFTGEGLPWFKKSISKVRTWTETQGNISNVKIFKDLFIDKINFGRELSEEEQKDYVRMYMGLVFVESAGKVDEKSPVGAAGLHQFMTGTGHGYNLRQKFWEMNIKDKHNKVKKIKKLIVDERYDPIKSCVACSNYLKDQYNDYLDDYLMLYQYNGVVGNYSKPAKDAGKEVTREGFLIWVSNDINRIKREAEDLDEFFHTVRPGDNTYKIAKFYGITEAQIRQLNPRLIPTKMHVGDEIMLPVTDHIRKQHYYKQIAKYVENLNYAPKIMAAARAIKTLQERGDYPEPEKRIAIAQRITPGKIKKAVALKKGIKSEHDISRLADIYNTPVNTLKAMNGIKFDKKGKPILRSSKLVILAQPTLSDYMRRMDKNRAEALREANSHIINIYDEIPEGVKINFIDHAWENVQKDKKRLG